jgi:hypothetical protein
VATRKRIGCDLINVIAARLARADRGLNLADLVDVDYRVTAALANSEHRRPARLIPPGSTRMMDRVSPPGPSSAFTMMTFGSQRRKAVAASLTALLIFHGTTPVWAWGRLGHRVISRFAKQHISEKARDALAELLEPTETIADASTWADSYRSQHRETGPWHYIDIPLDESKYDAKWSKDDAKHGCVVDKIHEFAAILKDNSRPVEERRKALRFLIHFIEDMHQPCHVGDNGDRGGNDTQIQWFGRGTNMRSLWDGGLLARVSNEEDYWLKELTPAPSSQTPDAATAGTVEDWATESLLAAREAYVDPLTGQSIKSGAKLGKEYYDKNLPVAKERLYRAGVRLARVLNECLE